MVTGVPVLELLMVVVELVVGRVVVGRVWW